MMEEHQKALADALKNQTGGAAVQVPLHITADIPLESSSPEDVTKHADTLDYLINRLDKSVWKDFVAW